jgi:predicted nuclease with TOPRIM domain
MSNIWFGVIATGIVILVAGYFLLQRKKEARKKQEEIERRLQVENEERSLLEEKQKEWRTKSEPLRSKLEIIISGDDFPLLENDDYLAVSHLFKDAGEGVEFIMQCDSYNALLQDDGIDTTPVVNRGSEAGHKELVKIASQIQVLLDKQISDPF